MRIPKIIHQTWKDENIPESFKELTKTWIEYHPDWDYFFWTDESNRKFVKSHFPELLKCYDGFEFNIQRADFIRYLILFKKGGVYVDMDFECLNNLEGLLRNHGCVFSIEPEEHCKMHGIDSMLCNAFMASIPGHLFIKLLINEATKQTANISNPNSKVMETTGPFMVTRVYNQNQNIADLKIFDSKYVYPLTQKEVFTLLNSETTPDNLQTKIDDCFAVHYWLNTWLV